MQQQDRDRLSIAIMGDDYGSSSTKGHLIFKLGVDSSTSRGGKKCLQEKAEEKGHWPLDFASFVQMRKEERERGVTIGHNPNEFVTEKYHYDVHEAPGFVDPVSYLVTRCIPVDVGLLTVPTERGAFEAAIAGPSQSHLEEEGPIHRLARLFYSLDVEQIIVGVHDMDAGNWSEDRFDEVKEKVVEMLRDIGWDTNMVPVVPYSGLRGDNLFEPTDKAPWYKGWTTATSVDHQKTKITGITLLDALDNFIILPRRSELARRPVRIPISNVHNIKGGVGLIVCGTVVQGTLQLGDLVGFVPCGMKGKRVTDIEGHRKSLPSAGPGDYVGLKIEGISINEKPQPGNTIYVMNEGELKPVLSFTATIAVQEHVGVIKVGHCPDVICCTAKVVCRITKILWRKSHEKTGQPKQDNPSEISNFDHAEVEFEPTLPFFVEPFERCKALGRISVLSSNRLKMVGKVTGTTTTTIFS